MSNNSELTPMMRQYLSIKEKFNDSFLFFRMGDFYELFFEDAQKASKILNITLTARGSHGGAPIPMCGVPYHSIDGYLAKMVAGNYTAAICEQVEDPKQAKGVVKREVVRVLTPGTVIDDSLLTSSKNNYLAAISKTGANFGVSYVELSTGEFKITEIKDILELERELGRIAPSEIIIPKFLDEVLMSSMYFQRNAHIVLKEPDWIFDFKHASGSLNENFKTHSLDGFGLKDLIPGISAAGAIIHYVKEKCPQALNNLKKISRYCLSSFMSLDEATKRNLELVQTPTNMEGNTLIKILDHTKTAMGARLLRNWVFSPLKELSPILSRQNAVTELKLNFEVLNGIREILKSVNDIERIITRICVGNAMPRDLLGLKESLLNVPKIKNEMKNLSSDLLNSIKLNLKDFTEATSLIEESISKECPVNLRDGNVIASGYNAPLDELRDISKNAKSKIAAIQKHESEKTGIRNLKIKFNNVFGYYLEVSKGQINQVPDYFIRKQTLVNAERYITEELKELESKILGAEQKSVSLEQKLFAEIREKIALFSDEIKNTSLSISELDVLAAFSESSTRYNYICPEVNESETIKIEEGRHPVVEYLLDAGTFVSNSTCLDNSTNQILLITGPNMAGKSTYIRQVALLTLMAQTGSHIPAKSAAIGIVDRIFSRVGAYDDLSGGKSTFMVEMNEMANILNNATSKSLIILDEVGRGTSTYDGISIAWAIIEYLYYESSVQAKTLFATHYHELTSLEHSLKGVKNFNINVKEWNDEIMFLHKIVEGAADKSYGIHVGRLAGLPDDVIKRAKELLLRLESGGMTELEVIGQTEHKKSRHETQMDLFTQPPPSAKIPENWLELMNKMANTDTLNMTPLESLNLLHKIVQESKKLLKDEG